MPAMNRANVSTMSKSREAAKGPKNDDRGGVSAPVAGPEELKEKEIDRLPEALSCSSRDSLEAALRLAVAKKKDRAIRSRKQGFTMPLENLGEAVAFGERAFVEMCKAMVRVVGREKAGEILEDYGQWYDEAVAV